MSSTAGADSFDNLNSSAVYGTLTVGTSPVEVKVGGSPLTKRKMVHIEAKDNSIYWGYSNSVTTSNGTRIFKDQTVFLPVGPDITIYLVADGASKSARIAELA